MFKKIFNTIFKSLVEEKAKQIVEDKLNTIEEYKKEIFKKEHDASLILDDTVTFIERIGYKMDDHINLFFPIPWYGSKYRTTNIYENYIKNPNKFCDWLELKINAKNSSYEITIKEIKEKYEQEIKELKEAYIDLLHKVKIIETIDNKVE